MSNIVCINISNGDLFGINAPGFDITISDANLNSTWYRLWNGSILTDNQTFTYGGDKIIDQSIWDQVGNGTVIISFYANDTMGNWNVLNITIRKDTHSPIIIFTSPNDWQLCNSTVPAINVDISGSNLHQQWYSFFNGSIWTDNDTWIDSEIDQILWNTAGNGTVRIRIWANNTVGATSMAELYLRKDIIAPIIVIDSPQNNEPRAEADRDFIIMIEEANLDTMWYSIAGRDNQTFTENGTLNQIDWEAAWEATADGAIFLIEFWANDTMGNLVRVTVQVKTNKPAPSTGDDDDDTGDDDGPDEGTVEIFGILMIIGAVAGLVLIIVKVVKGVPGKERLTDI